MMEKTAYKLHNLYTSQSIIRVIKPRVMRGAEHVGHVGRMKNAYKIFLGKCEGKRPCGRQRHRWEDREIGGKVWTGFIWLRIQTSGRQL
jgi:hypothetical protein